MAEVPSISVGLGAGDPAQYYKAAMIAALTHRLRSKQTQLPAAAARRAHWRRQAASKPHNAPLVSRQGTLWRVVISTGVSSSEERQPAFPVKRQYA